MGRELDTRQLRRDLHAAETAASGEDSELDSTRPTWRGIALPFIWLLPCKYAVALLELLRGLFF